MAGMRCATTRGDCARRWARARARGVDPDEAEVDHRRFRLWVPFPDDRARRLLPHPRGRARGDPRLRGAPHRPRGAIGSPGGLPSRARVSPGHTATSREEHSRSATRTGDARAQDHAERHARGRSGLRVLRRLARRRQCRRLARRRAGRRARPLSDPARHTACGPPHIEMRRRLGPTEFPCRVVSADGSEGMAHFEHHVFGRYEPYDLGRLNALRDDRHQPRRLHRGHHAGPSRGSQHDRAADVGGARRGGDQRHPRPRGEGHPPSGSRPLLLCRLQLRRRLPRTGTRTSRRTANGMPGAT